MTKHLALPYIIVGLVGFAVMVGILYLAFSGESAEWSVFAGGLSVFCFLFLCSLSESYEKCKKKETYENAKRIAIRMSMGIIVVRFWKEMDDLRKQENPDPVALDQAKERFSHATKLHQQEKYEELVQYARQHNAISIEEKVQ